jgi:hypothetical protein
LSPYVFGLGVGVGLSPYVFGLGVGVGLSPYVFDFGLSYVFDFGLSYVFDFGLSYLLGVFSGAVVVVDSDLVVHELISPAANKAVME